MLIFLGVDNEVYSDFAKLLASSSNVESADVPSSMQVIKKSYHIIWKTVETFSGQIFIFTQCIFLFHFLFQYEKDNKMTYKYEFKDI